MPFLRSYFVKTQRPTIPSSSISSSFINKDIFKKTILKTNNNNTNNNTSFAKWGNIWKWSKAKASSTTTTGNVNAKVNSNKNINVNNDNENAWGIPTLRLRDQSGNIISINSNTAVPIDTKYFKGKFLFIIYSNK